MIKNLPESHKSDKIVKKGASQKLITLLVDIVAKGQKLAIKIDPYSTVDYLERKIKAESASKNIFASQKTISICFEGRFLKEKS